MKIIGLYGKLEYLTESKLEEDIACHDSGATLFVDGYHIRSINEERLNRVKEYGGFPEKSIDYVLGDYSKDDVDIVCYVPTYPWNNIFLYNEVTTTSKKIWYEGKEKEASNLLRDLFPHAEVWYLSHHLCHAASTVFTSPFNSGSFLTLDGLGSGLWDFATGNIRGGENNSIGYFNKRKKIFRFFRMPGDVGENSFGEFYCQWSKMIYEGKCKEIGKEYDDDRTPKEGKIMGLASYGNKIDAPKPYTLANDFAKELFDIEKYDFGHNVANFYDYRMVFNSIQGSLEDKAYYLQRSFEDALLGLVKSLQNDGYLEDNHCFAGGSFLNVCANSLLKPLFKNMHIPPYTNDSGIHFGAAAYAAYKTGSNPRMPKNNISYLGKSYEDFVPDEENMEYYEDFDLLCETVAYELEKNKIVGWFQGRSEHGPRALGNRSILMSPTQPENKDILNKRIKHREHWRPYAGIMLEERIDDYFLEGEITPYMLSSQHAISDRIPAIVHEDKTCRIQTVNKKQNPKMCHLLSKFEDPILLNTSFNKSGEPIIETPEDAIRGFKNMDLDFLVIGNYILWN